MKGHESQRQRLLEKLADHLLAHGMQAASLRTMATAVGTSDRMLLYYFSDKNDLLAAVLSRVADRLIHLLESAQAEPLPIGELLPRLTKVIQDPRIQPYTKLWLELAALSGRHQEPYRTVARRICEGFLDWTANALQVDKEAQREPLSTFLFATIEGLVLLDAVGMDHAPKNALKGFEALDRPRRRK